ncbi:MAG: hypothetical protein KBD47_03445 [Candidatus Pacebacteria bacterium]|jgi:hypothetical protein|nr:hypothetical protein [Candidatus Paceibacterota bacterium]
MEKVLDKKFDDLKVYIGSEMDRYLGLQRDGFRDDLRIMLDSVVISNREGGQGRTKKDSN